MRVKRFCCNVLLLAIGFFSQFLLINSCVGATYGGGSGTAEAPYLISEPNHLHCIHTEPNDWDKHFLLVNDIDLSNRPDLVFSPIGGQHADPFTGVFDGNSHSIINFTCVSTRGLSVGLFGYASRPAVIKDLGLIDPNIQAENAAYVGSLVGEISNCTIENCWAVGIQVKGKYVVGGLFGYCWYGSEDYPIANCHASGRVEGKGSVGGLIGSTGGYIKDCHSEGQVIATESAAGGLAASSRDVILDSYSTCDVTGIDYVGGLVGYNYNGYTNGTYDSDIKIVSCYSTGSVSGNEYVGGLVGGLSESLVYGCYSTSEVSGASLTGGLVGDIIDGRVLNSFWDIQTSGQVISAGGQGKNTEQMQSSETFISWGCQPVWTIDDGNDYPHLVWENQPGVLIEKFNYGGGEGTLANPYMICTAEQLNTIGLLECDWDKHFKLMEDIDLSSYDANNLNLIGDYIDYNENTPFTGVFDGNSHSISNFSYTSFDQSAIGLFRYVGGSLARNAWIKNLTLINPQVNGGDGRRIGSLVGMLKYGTVVNCSAIGGTVEGNYETGGLVGYFKGYRTLGYAISDCNTDIDVSGSSGVGGLVGNNESGEITNCSSIGDVYGSGDGVGGLIGYSSGIIYGCFSNGNVEGENLVGGLVGSSKESITDSYATGSVVGIGDFIGGLAGRHFGGVISNSYARGDVSGGGQKIGGLVGSNAGGIDYSKISNCYATGSVEGGEIVGGLAGYNWEGYIFNSYAIGPVIGNKDVGGLAGYNLRGDIFNSYATGSVTGDENVGGLVGRKYSSDGDIINSYATGLVTGNIKAGGLIGDGIVLPFTNSVVDSFWDVNSTGLSLSGGGQGKTTVEMQTLETYQPWFCTYLWKIDEGNDYPRFVWEDGPGEPIVPPNYAGGSGVPADPYRIETAEQMNSISLYPCQWDDHFVLVDDIDLSDYDGQQGRPVFNIIGKDDSFTGVFDGNGHTISNFTYEVTDGSSDIGLFASVSSGGGIHNLTLNNTTILGNGSYVGALTGVCSGDITNCASINGNVQGNNFIGGLIGSFIYGTISNSFAKGSVLGDNNVVGGLVGTTEGYGGIIDNSYSQGIVSGYGDVGGFLGIGSIPIHHCYSSCEVTGLINVGAMTGYAKTAYPPPPYPYPPPPPPTYNKCFWEKTLNPDLEGIGNNIVDPNLVGLTTVEFMTIQPFEDAGWDFLNIWSICEGTNYPHLQWHIPQGDYICPDGVNFYDFAHFSQRWFQDNCNETNNYCDGADLDNLGSVGSRDLAIFCDYWLVGVR